MFTGLIERIGVIENIESAGDARHFVICVPDAEYLAGTQIGDSIAVSGACLTVTEREERRFGVAAVEETLRRTTLGAKNAGDRVNLERALQASARLGGADGSGG